MLNTTQLAARLRSLADSLDGDSPYADDDAFTTAVVAAEVLFSAGDAAATTADFSTPRELLAGALGVYLHHNGCTPAGLNEMLGTLVCYTFGPDADVADVLSSAADDYR